MWICVFVRDLYTIHTYISKYHKEPGRRNQARRTKIRLTWLSRLPSQNWILPIVLIVWYLDCIAHFPGDWECARWPQLYQQRKESLKYLIVWLPQLILKIIELLFLQLKEEEPKILAWLFGKNWTSANSESFLHILHSRFPKIE